ncbi:MAG: GGDEF domain-containing protein [Betaproteobacteria bacterium HGW-Betaproteobacteria-22]|nr:MAG: GGDEF domain-containing protein [Betaproteobacteria bacterium HGW-Betaproteobacteria-22]
MTQNINPLEVARQTLIRLAKSQKQPTPENYQLVYDEIAGTDSAKSAGNQLEHTLEKILLEKGKTNPKYAAIATKLAGLANKKDHAKLEALLQSLIDDTRSAADSAQWGNLLRYLLKQLDVNHTGMTLSRKKDGLNRVILNFGNDANVLAQKIQALVTSWGDGKPVGFETPSTHDTNHSNSAEKPSNTAHEALPDVPPHTAQPDSRVTDTQLAEAWRDMLLRTINVIVVPQFHGIPSAEHRIKSLIARALAAKDLAEIAKINQILKSTLLRAEMQTDAHRRMQEALIEILRLLVSSMAELTIEDEWLHAQICIIKEIIASPLKIDTIYNAESSLKELIFKQAQLKPSLQEAKDTLRNMVSTFVSRLADIANSSGDYQNKIQHYHDQINETDDIAELSTILEHLVSDISAMSSEAKQNHEELQAAQAKAAEAEKKINELTLKLDYISEAAHEDFLTGALNRRGMDEAIIREFERADRHGTALSLAMLDIDHFKKINDSMGHSAGDKALAHLAKVVKSILRSTDVLARYGGEEFVILLPGSNQDDAVTVISGLQRELTKNFFLHNNERVLITFSAGVAERVPGEEIDSILPRADAALYIAKQSGRNRVVGADDHKHDHQ